MSKTQLPSNKAATILEILGFVSSIAFLAAIIQHVNHLNQVNQHLIAAYLSHTAAPGFTVESDFQLIPLVPIALLLLLAGIVVRRRLSPLLLVSLTIFLSSCIVWLFGFKLVQI
jgi:hypothetical protein